MSGRMRTGVTVATCAGLLGAGAPAFGGTATLGGGAGGAYDFTIRGAAAAYFVENPRPLPHYLGYAAVNLRRAAGAAIGRCQATGAGYLLAPEVEDGWVLDIMDQRHDPASPDSGGGYYNPTVARSVAPNEARNPRLGSTDPALYSPESPGGRITTIPHDAPPLRWTAACASDLAGTATGDNLDVPGARAAAGYARAEVDKATGGYEGLARGYATGLRTADGTPAVLHSLIRVAASPGAEPRVSYVLSLAAVNSTGADSDLGHGGFTLAGRDLPAAELVRQFNTAVRAAGHAVSALGPAGLAVLEPAVHRARDGRLTITAPVLTANAGSALRRGDLGQNVCVQFGFAEVVLIRR